MTRIDFYQVSGDESLFACRLISKIYQGGHQIHVHAADQAQAERLDEQLWSFRPDAFLPHVLHGSQLTAPIRIGFGAEQAPTGHQDVLVNLASEIPQFFSQFDRVAEVVPADASNRDAARRNYAYYKEQGYPLKYHEIQASV